MRPVRFDSAAMVPPESARLRPPELCSLARRDRCGRTKTEQADRLSGGVANGCWTRPLRRARVSEARSSVRAASGAQPRTDLGLGGQKLAAGAALWLAQTCLERHGVCVQQ